MGFNIGGNSSINNGQQIPAHSLFSKGAFEMALL
jgi:hypothetical protein